MGDRNANIENPILKAEQDAQVGMKKKNNLSILISLLFNGYCVFLVFCFRLDTVLVVMLQYYPLLL